MIIFSKVDTGARQGSRCRVQGLGFGGQGLGFGARVHGSRFESGLGFTVQGLRIRVKDSRFTVKGKGSRFRVQVSQCRIHSFLFTVHGSRFEPGLGCTLHRYGFTV